jgi:hypothetical protein
MGTQVPEHRVPVERAPAKQAPVKQAGPALAVMAGGKLLLVDNGASTAVGPGTVPGITGRMTVTAFEWSASGRYLGWQQTKQSTGASAVGWYDTVTHRRMSWRFAYEASEDWSVTGSGMASLAAGDSLNAPATLTSYGTNGAVTHRSVRVRTSLTVAGYSGGFIIGPDIVSDDQLWRVSLSGQVTRLPALPKPPENGLYEVTAASPDGKIFAAELGDHTDGCGVGPASRIFVEDEATGTVRQASLPGGSHWRVQSFVFDPTGTLDATLVDCTQQATMSTTVFSVSPAGTVTSQRHGALVATKAGGSFAYQAGHIHLGGTEAPVLEEVASGPLTVNGRAVPGGAVAATASWAP